MFLWVGSWSSWWSTVLIFGFGVIVGLVVTKLQLVSATWRNSYLRGLLARILTGFWASISAIFCAWVYSALRAFSLACFLYRINQQKLQIERQAKLLFQLPFTYFALSDTRAPLSIAFCATVCSRLSPSEFFRGLSLSQAAIIGQSFSNPLNKHDIELFVYVAPWVADFK